MLAVQLLTAFGPSLELDIASTLRNIEAGRVHGAGWVVLTKAASEWDFLSADEKTALRDALRSTGIKLMVEADEEELHDSTVFWQGCGAMFLVRLGSNTSDLLLLQEQFALPCALFNIARDGGQLSGDQLARAVGLGFGLVIEHRISKTDEDILLPLLLPRCIIVAMPTSFDSLRDVIQHAGTCIVSLPAMHRVGERADLLHKHGQSSKARELLQAVGAVLGTPLGAVVAKTLLASRGQFATSLSRSSAFQSAPVGDVAALARRGKSVVNDLDEQYALH